MLDWSGCTASELCIAARANCDVFSRRLGIRLYIAGTTHAAQPDGPGLAEWYDERRYELPLRRGLRRRRQWRAEREERAVPRSALCSTPSTAWRYAVALGAEPACAYGCTNAAPAACAARDADASASTDADGIVVLVVECMGRRRAYGQHATAAVIVERQVKQWAPAWSIRLAPKGQTQNAYLACDHLCSSLLLHSILLSKTLDTRMGYRRFRYLCIYRPSEILRLVPRLHSRSCSCSPCTAFPLRSTREPQDSRREHLQFGPGWPA